MNQLPISRRAAIIRALVEGNSIRATARLTGTAKGTVLSLLVDLGELASIYQDHVIRGLSTKRVQCDEIWSFVGCKERMVPKGQRHRGRGDVWTWTALDQDSKLMITWLVGNRDRRAATAFMVDLRSRLANRVQLTTDAFNGYLPAVEAAFGWDGVDYARLVKVYSSNAESHRRYSPPVCVGAEKEWIMGEPIKEDVSTSHVERQNLTMRMHMRRFTRLTNGFSKKAENHSHSVSLHFLYYNFVRPHKTLGLKTTPAMAAGLTTRPVTVEEIAGWLDPRTLLQSA